MLWLISANRWLCLCRRLPPTLTIYRWDGADPKNVGLYDIFTGGLCMYDNCQNNEVDSTLSVEPVNGRNPCLKKLKLFWFIIQSSKMVSLDNTPSKRLQHSTESPQKTHTHTHTQQHSLLINNELFTFTTTFTPHQQPIIHTHGAKALGKT